MLNPTKPRQGSWATRAGWFALLWVWFALCYSVKTWSLQEIYEIFLTYVQGVHVGWCLQLLTYHETVVGAEGCSPWGTICRLSLPKWSEGQKLPSSKVQSCCNACVSSLLKSLQWIFQQCALSGVLAFAAMLQERQWLFVAMGNISYLIYESFLSRASRIIEWKMCGVFGML